MGEGRVWNWDLDEMKIAAENDKDPIEPYAYPIVSAFTPVNAPALSEAYAAADIAIMDGVTSKENSTRKRRKTGPPPTARAPDSRKSTTITKSKQVRKVKGNVKDKNQNTSRELPVKKPLSPSDVALSDQTVPQGGPILPDQVITAESVTESLPCISESPTYKRVIHKLPPDGLGAKYESAYSSEKNPSGEFTIQQEQNKSSANLLDKEFADDICQATEPTRRIDAVRPTSQFVDHADEALEPCITPPSAQIERERSAEQRLPMLYGVSKVHSIHTSYFDSDEIFADAAESDDYPLEDDYVEDIMQAMNPKADMSHQSIDLQPRGFSDTLLLSDKSEGTLQQDVSSNQTHPARTHTEHLPSDDPLVPTDSIVQKAHFQDVVLDDSGHGTEASPDKAHVDESSQDCFNDDDLDEGLLGLNSQDGVIQPQTPETSPDKPSAPKLQWMKPTTYKSKKRSRTPVVPPENPDHVFTTEDRDNVPIIRLPFPRLARDRSPILGLMNSTVLRMCFRIGEALNAAAVASRNNTDAVIELYARVMYSEREINGGLKQYFQFGDLFTDKPPFLSGSYNLWRGVPLWKEDSGVFLGGKARGKMARVMGRIKRPEKGATCEITVLSIWEIDWEDVQMAKGIICF